MAEAVYFRQSGRLVGAQAPLSLRLIYTGAGSKHSRRSTAKAIHIQIISNAEWE